MGSSLIQSFKSSEIVTILSNVLHEVLCDSVGGIVRFISSSGLSLSNGKLQSVDCHFLADITFHVFFIRISCYDSQKTNSQQNSKNGLHT